MGVVDIVGDKFQSSAVRVKDLAAAGNESAPRLTYLPSVLTRRMGQQKLLASMFTGKQFLRRNSAQPIAAKACAKTASVMRN
jgi:hypothetical protein